MFTGIVSAVGTVLEANPNRLGIREPAIAAALTPGSSVAVNGCCLTATTLKSGCFFADVVPETLGRTNLGALEAGSQVNLELPVALGGRLDGHLVQGHIDGTTSVLSVVEVEAGRELTFELPPALEPYLVEKGSIAVDGVSLTVAAVGEGRFAVAFIPHTLAATIARTYEPGAVVNLEVDLMARYAERLLRLGRT